MRPWTQRWWIYRPRIGFYLTLLLFALVAPSYVSTAVRLYLALSIAGVALALVGLEAFFFLTARQSDPMPRWRAWFPFASVGAGAAAVALSIAVRDDTLYELGVLAIIIGVESALWSREANCRRPAGAQRRQ